MVIAQQRIPTEIRITPHGEAQARFIQSQSKYSAALAGLGGGKTHAGTVRSLILAIQYPGIRGWVTAPVFKTLNDATIPKYEEIFGQIPDFARFLGGDNPRAELANGSEILFRSTDKPDNLRGGEIGFFHMDEAAQSSYYSFQILQGRLRQRNKNGEFYPLQGWLTTTPKGLNWIYHEFIVLENRPNYEYFTWKTADNYYLPPEYLDGMDYTGKFRAQELEAAFLNLEGESLFSIENLDRRQKMDCKEPTATYHDGYVKVWKEPLVGVKYVAGADCADEGGGGFSCMVIINQAGEEHLEIHGDISSDTFSKLCDEWGRKYNNALLGVECNGTVGGYVTAKLKDMGYPRLYKRKNDKLGWYTDGFNRAPMLEEYRHAVNRNQTLIYCAEAIAEMRTFVSKPTGKYEHMDRCFDDRVMARAIALRMIQERQGMGMAWRSWKRQGSTY